VLARIAARKQHGVAGQGLRSAGTREMLRGGVAGHQNVAKWVEGHGDRRRLPARADCVVEQNLGIDRQIAVRIVRANEKAYVARALQPIGNGHLAAAAAQHLIRVGARLANGGDAGLDQQIAAFIDPHVPRAFESQVDGQRIVPGGNVKVIFQAPLVAVVDEVDAGVDAAHSNASIKRRGLGRVPAQQIVDPRGEFFARFERHAGRSAGQAHAHISGGQVQARAIARNGQRTRGAAGNKHSAARFKSQRKLERRRGGG